MAVACLKVVQNTGKPWFAIQVRAKMEPNVEALLNNKGFETFLPLYPASVRWSDRIKQIKKPLFPGYLFCQLDPAHRLPVLTTPGVIGIVGGPSGPIAVEEGEISAVRQIIDSNLLFGPWPGLTVGDHVEVCHGPLRGIEGLVTEVQGGFRLIVRITLLQRSVFVNIERSSIQPVAKKHTHISLPRKLA